MHLILVMIGGAVGAGLRYGVGRVLPTLAESGWPWPTLAVNLLGGLCMGLLAGWMVRSGADDAWRLLLGVGVLGGFTTFSAFGLDTLMMLQSGRPMAALSYVCISVIGAVFATWIGLYLIRGATT